MKTLIIGGTGKVGIEITKQLALENIPAKILVRSHQSAEKVEIQGLEPIIADIADINSVRLSMKGIEKLFLLIPASPFEAELKNAIIDESKKAGVKYIILLSGAGADPASLISQAQQHSKAEEHLKSSGISFTILRPNFFMQNFFNQLGGYSQTGNIRLEATLYGNFGDGKIAMVDTRDIASVAVQCLKENGHEGKTYIITGGEAVSYTEAALLLTTVLGKKVYYVNLTSENLINGMITLGTPEWLAKDLAMLGEDFAAGKFVLTTNVVESITGRKPITFEQFVKDYAYVFN